MLNNIFKYFKLLLSAYFIYFVFNFIKVNYFDLKMFFSNNLLLITLIIILKFLIIFSNSLIFMKIVNLTNIKIKFLSAYELTLLNYIGNFVGPFKLGTGLKIQNLSKNYNLDLKHFLIKNINFTIYNFLIYILIFLFSLYKESIINLSLLIFSAAITITILILLSLKQIFKKNNFFQISEFISDWLFLFLIIFLFLIGSTIVFIEANIISEDTFTFIKSIFIFQGISFTNLVNITPANLGIRELALLGIGSLHSLSLKDLFNIGLIDRFCGIIATLILFIFFNLKKLILLINNKTK